MSHLSRKSNKGVKFNEDVKKNEDSDEEEEREVRLPRPDRFQSKEKEIVMEGTKVSFSGGDKLKSLDILIKQITKKKEEDEEYALAGDDDSNEQNKRKRALDIKKMTEIDISNNEIASIQKLTHFTRLLKIEAAYNSIQKVKLNVQLLTYLDLSFNNLEEVSHPYS